MKNSKKSETVIKKEISQWFYSRGFEQREYQIDAIYEVLSKLNGKPVVLAASCGGGKTVMIHVIVERILKEIRGSRAIILPHGTNVLKDQFNKSLIESVPDFDWTMLKSGQKTIGKEKVILTLPQTIHKMDLSEFDNGNTILVIDEGHQFTNAPMVQEIIRKVKPKHILILTGTPSPFVLKKYPLITVPMSRLINEKRLSNVATELVSSNYVYGIGDLAGTLGTKDMKKKFNFKEKETIKTLNGLLRKVQLRLKLDGDWKKVAHDMCKTMYVCRNGKQAKQVQKYFVSKNIDCAMSLYDTDKEGMEITRFRNSPTCSILIVVYRGILGFDYEELCHVIDLSGTGNIDRIFQMMSRLVRLHPHSKVYFKVVPHKLKTWYRPIMNAALSLIDEDNLRLWNGKNFKDLKILTREMSEMDFETGGIYEEVLLKAKRSVDEEFVYDIIKFDEETEKEVEINNLSFEGFLVEIGLLPKTDKKGGPGNDKTTKEGWIDRKNKSIKNLAANLTSTEFFVDALENHKKYGIYALTTNQVVYEILQYIKKSPNLSYEAIKERFIIALKNAA